MKLQKNGRVHKNVYNKGLNKNVEAVLGNYPWYYAILPSTRVPPKISFSHMISRSDMEI